MHFTCPMLVLQRLTACGMHRKMKELHSVITTCRKCSVTAEQREEVKEEEHFNGNGSDSHLGTTGKGDVDVEHIVVEE